MNLAKKFPALSFKQLYQQKYPPNGGYFFVERLDFVTKVHPIRATNYVILSVVVGDVIKQVADF